MGFRFFHKNWLFCDLHYISCNKPETSNLTAIYIMIIFLFYIVHNLLETTNCTHSCVFLCTFTLRSQMCLLNTFKPCNFHHCIAGYNMQHFILLQCVHSVSGYNMHHIAIVKCVHSVWGYNMHHIVIVKCVHSVWG